MASLPPAERDAARRDLLSVQAQRERAVVATSASARKKTQQVWRTLCGELGHTALLEGLRPQDRIHVFELFGERYRTGRISKSGKPVQAHTVEVALGDVGALFSDMGVGDPRLRPGGTTYVPALKKWLVSLQKEDPPSTRVYPCNVTILRGLCDGRTPSARQAATRDLAIGGFFYMNRPGELLKTTKKDLGRSAPFRLGDVTFHRRNKVLSVRRLGPRLLNDGTRHAASRPITGCSAASLTYSTQKICVKGEVITHLATGDALVCPVRALERRVSHLLQHGASLDTPLYIYYNDKNDPIAITTAIMTAALRKAAKRVQSVTGIPPDRISSRSLRPGGATALLCADQNPTCIALVGRWRSEAMLRYLRAQTTPAAKRFAALMLQHGSFSFNPVDDTSDTEFLGIPRELPSSYRDRFDPSDDASDDESDPDD